MVTKRQSVDAKTNAATAATAPGKKRQTQAAAQTKPGTFQLPPGLYAIRALPHPQHPAVNPVTLSQVPVGKARVDFLPAADIVDETFTQPHDCIAVRVMNDTATMIATKVDQGEASSIRLGIERIDVPKTEANPESVVPPGLQQQATVKTAVRPAYTSVRMLGHVEGVGDTIVQDQWLGNPRGNARLEGFAIKVKGLPDTVKLVYGCKFITPTLKSQVSSTGQFVGTRRQAQPIRSVVFGLEGPGADRYQLAGQVAFSGAYNKQEVLPLKLAQELQGSRLDAHLVAIHLQVVAKSDVTPTAITPIPGDNMEDHEIEEIKEVESSQAEILDVQEDGADLADATSSDPDDQDGAWTDDDIAELFGR